MDTSKVEKLVLDAIGEYPIVDQEDRENFAHWFADKFEPVELETLGDEELVEAITGNKAHGYIPPILVDLTRRDRKITQATIQHNQKGQLFRLKEEA